MKSCRWSETLVLTCLALCACFSSAGAGGLVDPSEERPQGLARLGIRCSPPDSGATPGGPFSSSWQRHVQHAANLYRDGKWAWAFREYKAARFYHPEDPRDPDVVLMIADCALRALTNLHDLMPAGMFPEGVYGKKIMAWLHDSYGYYAGVSEGESFWHYDMRALRFFLRVYPNHDQADEVAYALVKEDLMFGGGGPAVFMVRDVACARAFIARHEDILRRYPRTELRGKIESDIALFRGYIDLRGPLPESVSNPW